MFISTSLRQTIYSLRERSRDCQEVLAEVQKHTNPSQITSPHSPCPAHHSAPGLSENPPPKHWLVMPKQEVPQGQLGLKTGYILKESKRMNENLTSAMHRACYL